MTDLTHILERLGLLQYLDNFIEEGFDTWEIVVYATESDLETLGLKLGHRRKLQKEIADARGISIDQIIGAASRAASTHDLGDSENKPSSRQPDKASTSNTSSGPSKRKYRRHPKPDENAPERAPSAYVIFSNKIREELKPQKLSFTDIAKTVGERWQVLDVEDKEQYEIEAAAAKENYNTALSKYKRTNDYRNYERYLAEFKVRNTPTAAGAASGPSLSASALKRPQAGVKPHADAGGKRPKLETELSTASTSSGASLNAVFQEAGAPRRKGSVISQATYSPPVSSAASPTAMPRLGLRSRDTSVPSSVSSTPINATFPSAGSMQYGASQTQSQSLPRIIPFESRDPRSPFLTNLLADSPPGPHSRRSGGGPTANLLRQEISRFPNASLMSSGNTMGPHYSATSPADDLRASRSLPPLPALLQHNSSGSTSSLDIERQVLSNIPPSWYDVGDQTTKSTAYTHPFHHISLASSHGESSRAGSQPSSQEQQHAPLTHLPRPVQLAQGLQKADPDPAQANIDRNRMDPLSALVLAGRLVDGESTLQPPSNTIEK